MSIPDDNTYIIIGQFSDIPERQQSPFKSNISLGELLTIWAKGLKDSYAKWKVLKAGKALSPMECE